MTNVTYTALALYLVLVRGPRADAVRRVVREEEDSESLSKKACQHPGVLGTRIAADANNCIVDLVHARCLSNEAGTHGFCYIMVLNSRLRV